MQQYLVVVIALFSHHGSTNLTQSHAVSPSGTGQYKSLWHAFCINVHAVYHEGRAVEMRVAQCASYLQFLTYGKGAFSAFNQQFAYPSAFSALHGFHVDDAAEVHFQFFCKQTLYLLL